MNSAWNAPHLTIRHLACLFGLALVPRLLLLAFGPWQDAERAMQPDSYRYLLLAENLREHQTFGLLGPGGLVHQSVVRLRAENGTLPPTDANGLRPESFRTPGYPVFIALVQSLGGGIRTVLFVQCLMGAAMAGLAALIGQSLGLPARCAFLIGLLWALHPGLIVFDCVLLTESLFNAVAVTGLFLACRLHSPWGIVSAGLLLGLATLVRPLGVLYIPAALALAWPQVRFRAAAVVILTVAAFLPPTLWAFRNQAVNEGFRVTTVGDLNLLYYTAAYAISEERREDWLESWPTRVDGLTNRLSRRLRPGEDVVTAARRLAWDQIRQRPKSVVKVQAKSWLKLFADHSLPSAAETLGIAYRPSGLFSNLIMNSEPRPQGPQGNSIATSILALGWMGLNVLIAVAAVVGANRALHRRDWRILVFGLVSILLFTLATGSVGLERFRLPMMLPLFVLAAGLFSVDRRTAAKRV
jgi:hypothetical protein